MPEEQRESVQVLAECLECGFYGKGEDSPAFRDLWQEHMAQHPLGARHVVRTWVQPPLWATRAQEALF